MNSVSVFKLSLIYIATLICSSDSFSQDYTEYQNYGGACLSTGLEYSYWLRPLEGASFTRSDGTYISHKITYKFRNSFDHTICFTYEIYNGNNRKIEYGRGCIQPTKESTLASWAHLESSNLPSLVINKVKFRREGFKEYVVRCDEVKRKFYWDESITPIESSSKNDKQNNISSSIKINSVNRGGYSTVNQQVSIDESGDSRKLKTNVLADKQRDDIIEVASNLLKNGNYEVAMLYYKQAQSIKYSEITNRIILDLENKLKIRKEKRENLTTNNPYYYNQKIKESEIEIAIKEVLDYYQSRESENRAIKKENFLKDVIDKVAYNNVNIGHAIDESIKRYDYPFGTTINYLAEYLNYKSRTDDLGNEIEKQWDDYLTNFFNRDPDYDIDKEYFKFKENVKIFILGLMSDKNGVVDFNALPKTKN